MQLVLRKTSIPESGTVYKVAQPFLARVLSNSPITEPGADADVHHIVLDLSHSGVQPLEGQSLGVIPPGIQEDGRPHRVRLYSIASPRSGDLALPDRITVALCVKRVVWTDEQGQTRRGLASNHLCDLRVGDLVPVIGPSGRTFLLPEDTSVNLILVAVGTGIAPFRAFIKHAFSESGRWKGKVRLYFGARTPLDNLYMNRASQDIGQYLDRPTFEAFQAFSRYEAEVPKQYVQDRIADHGSEILQMIQEGNCAFYICGLKGMETGIDDVLAKECAQKGLDWSSIKSNLKSEGRWNIEVY